jgi:hypothetical protein
MRARRTLWFIISAVASTIGCADSVSVAPQDFVGEYVLTRVAGEPLPTLIFSTDFSPTVVADTLRLRADGTGSRMRLVVLSPGTSRSPRLGFGSELATKATMDSGVDTTIRLTSVAATNLTFEVVGGLLAITYVCPINADCAPPPHAIGVRTSVGLTVTREGTARVPEEFVLIRR